MQPLAPNAVIKPNQRFKEALRQKPYAQRCQARLKKTAHIHHWAALAALDNCADGARHDAGMRRARHAPPDAFPNTATGPALNGIGICVGKVLGGFMEAGTDIGRAHFHKTYSRIHLLHAQILGGRA